MTNAELAFKFSLQRLEDHVEKRNQKLYFWTFTFAEDLPLSWCMLRWNGFMASLQTKWRNEIYALYGARVVELQKSGRPHFHAIFNQRLDINMIADLSEVHGFGWKTVKKVWSQRGAAEYMAKYMSKQYGRYWPERTRRFAMIGGFDGCKVRDIKFKDLSGFEPWKIMRDYFGGRIPYPVVSAMRRSIWTPHDRTFRFCLRYMMENKNVVSAFYWTPTEMIRAFEAEGLLWPGEGLGEWQPF